MKKTLLLFAFLPLLISAQNITNTLGASGTYIIEDVSNASVFRSSRVASGPKVFIGDWASGFSLPATGNISLLFNNATPATPFATNIIVGNGFNSGAVPTLNFYYTPQSLVSPVSITSDVAAANTLGLIGFGGYLNSGWRSDAAKISVSVTGTSGSNIATTMTFTTQNSAAAQKNLVFDDAGNLTVPGLSGGSPTDVQADANGKLVLTVSDKRYKNNIKPLNYGLAEILELKPVSYYWNDKNLGDNKVYGFIAQDIYPIMPEVVPLNQEGFHTYNSSYIIPVLVTAIQEQQEQIETLIAEKALLSAALAEQESRFIQFENRLQNVENLVAPTQTHK